MEDDLDLPAVEEHMFADDVIGDDRRNFEVGNALRMEEPNHVTDSGTISHRNSQVETAVGGPQTQSNSTSAAHRQFKSPRRPVVRRRGSASTSGPSTSSALLEMMQMQLAIDKQRLEEQREERAERFRLWELEQKARREQEDNDRRERREQAAREEKRHSDMMQLLAMSFTKGKGPTSSDKRSDEAS